ncbi:MAG: DNA mismatch endonuclease Vsr [Candidatus Aminicenantes bacterium]|nr:DNA mismatch endonuclease Vsr [Candidatus Aminicenantes bacterium]
MDIWPKEKRSEVMSRIRSKDTKPEKLVRSLLHRMGYRFRVHVKYLPGKPDIVMKKYNAIIFVHGCFWHLHDDCNEGRIPSTRTEYWAKKLLGNKARDEKHMNELTNMGWRVMRVWECEIEKKTEETIERIINFLGDVK